MALVSVVVACHAASPPVTAPSQPMAASAPAPAAPVANVAPVDAPDSSGWTPLQRAAESGDVAEIDRLLAAGANLEATSPTVYQGATALVIALEFSQPAAAKLLLDRGASIAGATGRNALELAARDEEDAILDELLARGVPVPGSKALFYAAEFGATRAIGKLVHAGADVNAVDHDDHDYTPLLVACQKGQHDAAKALLAAGAHIDARDTDGMSVLHWAVFGERPVEQHIYYDLRKPHLTRRIQRPDAPVVRLLISRGAALDARDGEGNTPLHQAAYEDARAAALLLVRAGANRRIRNNAGETPIDIASGRHNEVEAVLKP